MAMKSQIIPDFRVDISSIASSCRKNGVSGMMRVKNDAEFIVASVESCIDALDELVIVYNDCSDNSPDIIHEMAEKYPHKIKVFHYLPSIVAWNLTTEEITEIENGTIPSERTLAGYYNYALSKTSYKYVMKIDADQIYFTEKLKNLCDLYRYETKGTIRIGSLLMTLIVKIYLIFAIRLKCKNKFVSNSDMWSRYRNAIFDLVKRWKINTSLSGINMVVTPMKPLISKGKEVVDGTNILPPYNGEGDHLIFKVTSDTYFVPKIDNAYNKLNKVGQSVIERLKGGGPVISIGLYWCHLNSYRKKTYANMRKYISLYSEAFADIDLFSRSDYFEEMRKNEFEMTTKGQSVHFDLIHNDLGDYEKRKARNINRMFLIDDCQ